MLSKSEQMLILKLEDEIKNLSDSLAQGGAKDYAEYRENCGYIDGLKSAVSTVHDINREITGGER